MYQFTPCCDSVTTRNNTHIMVAELLFGALAKRCAQLIPAVAFLAALHRAYLHPFPAQIGGLGRAQSILAQMWQGVSPILAQM